MSGLLVLPSMSGSDQVGTMFFMSGLEEGVFKSGMSGFENEGCPTFYVWARGGSVLSSMAGTVGGVTLYFMSQGLLIKSRYREKVGLPYGLAFDLLITSQLWSTIVGAVSLLATLLH